MGWVALPLNRGHSTLVDTVDEEIARPYSWHVNVTKWTSYAVTNFTVDGNRTSLKLHRLIMGCYDPAIIIDHKNGNGLDNRRSNLRYATKAENCRNARPQGGSSQFKGVHWKKELKGWYAQIGTNGSTRALGLYATEEDAARAYNDAAAELHGEFARLNEVEDIDTPLSRRSNKAELIPAFSELRTCDQWVTDDRCVVSNTSLRRRLKQGWPPERAMSLPRQYRPRTASLTAFGETRLLADWPADDRCIHLVSRIPI